MEGLPRHPVAPRGSQRRPRMTRTPRIDTAERRRRIAVRHHLAPACRGSDVTAVAAELVGYHATDPTSVYIGAFARVEGVTAADIARVLYDDRSLIKVLGMRRTMFATTAEIAGIINSAVTRKIVAAERKRLLQWLAEADVAPDVKTWLDEVEAQTVATLDELGAATATELTRRVPGLRVQISFGAGKYGQARSAFRRECCSCSRREARIIRGRPRGTWVSSMYEWAPMDRWVPGGLVEPPERTRHRPSSLPLAARIRSGHVARHPVVDGIDRGITQAVAGRRGAVEVDLDEGVGFALPSDLQLNSRPRSVDRARAVARHDDDGLEGARLVPRCPCRSAVRHDRQRGADNLGRRPHRRRVGSAQGRRNRSISCSRTWVARQSTRSGRKPHDSGNGWPTRA